jgi:hypothetical protein
MRLAKWVIPCITPELYHTVDLWTELQAASFLRAIQSNKTYTLCQPRHFVCSVIINTAAFTAYDTQHVHALGALPVDVGRLTPGGATTMTTFAILTSLSEKDCTRWKALTAPMVILATRRYPPPPPLIMPCSVTMTGVDSLSWEAYNWDNVETIRFTSYNPSLQEARWLAALPKLSHVAFAFYYEIPLGVIVLEELIASSRIQCVLIVVFHPYSRHNESAKEVKRRSLRKLDEPKLVIWEDTPHFVDLFETEDSERLWKVVDSIVGTQALEKQAALLQ